MLKIFSLINNYQAKGIANIIPSNLSSNPPCPGNNFPVSLIFALRLRKEMNKSPSCEIDETIIIINIISLKLKKSLKMIITPDIDAIYEPIIPEYVLLGLIFVIFFPLKIFPKKYPPVSVKIQIVIKKYKIIFWSPLFDKKIWYIISEKYDV